MKRAILGLIIAALLILMALVYPVRADITASVYSGTWEITYVDCQGNSRVFKNCKVTEIGQTFVTFFRDNKRGEIRLPLTSSCSSVIMERKR